MTANGSPTYPWRQALGHFQKLRNFAGDQKEYWALYLQALLEIGEARSGLIAIKSPIDASGWRTIAALAGGAEGPARTAVDPLLEKNVSALAQQCNPRGYALLTVPGGMILAVNVLIESDPFASVALLLVDRLDPGEVADRFRTLVSVNDLPAQFRLQQSAFEALKNQNRLAEILDLLVLVNAQKRFVAAAMTVCNELSSRYRCDRVSLGWCKKGTIKITAMSHTDQFEKKMSAVQQLELAMEEAFDQESEIVLPNKPGAKAITRDSEEYAKASDVRFLATLPVRVRDEISAVVTLERATEEFTEGELRHLRIMLDQTSPRLSDIRRRDRWFGVRFADWLRELLARFLGYKHTWAKALGIAGALALLFICVVPVRYRVDSPMILRTDDITYVTAPFDGYIDSVGVRAGDLVKAGGMLLSLDTKDLLLEQAGLMAEKNRQEREVEKSRAAGELAEMLIAQARRDQAVAKLETNEFRISQASILSARDGVVIEGDQAEKLGSPVKLGEILFKIGSIRNIYAEAKVSENEIQNVADAAEGQIALASRPQDPFDVAVEVIEPSAVPTQKDNAFNVRCRFRDSIPDWFRPGMTGVSKLNAGRRTLFWIISHRTLDFLRLKLWW
jgi:multidrug resistance efflux pump